MIKEELFWAKVNKTDTCWLWTGSRAGGRYGKFGHKENGKTLSPLAHRVAFELAGNELLLPGMQLDHICHNVICVNPEHLRQVSQSQNQQHRRSANRGSATGVLGVSRTRYGKPFLAHAKHLGKSHYGGTFNTLEEAEAAAIALRNRIFTNNDHDRKRQ